MPIKLVKRAIWRIRFWWAFHQAQRAVNEAARAANLRIIGWHLGQKFQAWLEKR